MVRNAYKLYNRGENEHIMGIKNETVECHIFFTQIFQQFSMNRKIIFEII